MAESATDKVPGKLPWVAPHLRTLPLGKTASAFVAPNPDGLTVNMAS